MTRYSAFDCDLDDLARTQDEIEHEIKSVDVVLRLLRADSSKADTIESKLAIQKHVRHIEGMRFQLRRELFAAMDAAAR